MDTSLKGDFPIFQEKGSSFIYLDSAATTHKPKVVIDEMCHFMANEYATVHRAVYSSSQIATQKYQRARELAAQFISCEPSEVIFTRGTTTSLNFLARAFDVIAQEGDVVLISAIEHHANFLPWVEFAKRNKLHLIQVPLRQGLIDLDFVEDICKKEKVLLMSIAHISNVLGIVQPIAALASVLHSHGAVCILDAAQSAPHIEINVKELDIDFLAFSGHKIYGPTGIGILYGKKELLDALPPVEFGGDMVIDADISMPVYQDPPLRFEAGTPSIVEVIGLAKAIEYLLARDRQILAQREEGLIHQLGKGLSRMRGIEFVGPLTPNRRSLLSFSFEDLHPLDIATFLDMRGICIRTGHLCAQPALSYYKVPALLRVSLGIYTDQRDIEVFLSNLEEVCSVLRGN